MHSTPWLDFFADGRRTTDNFGLSKQRTKLTKEDALLRMNDALSLSLSLSHTHTHTTLITAICHTSRDRLVPVVFLRVRFEKVFGTHQ